MKKFLLASILILGLNSAVGTTHAADLRPPLGVWEFCTTNSQIGCIKKATITAPGAEAMVATTASQVNAAGVTLRVECGFPANTGLTATDNCSSDFPITGCTSTRMGGGLAQLGVSLTAQTYPTRVQIEISTGAYKPRFGMGNGTRSMKVSANGDGTYTYVLDTTIDIIPHANIPSEILSLLAPPVSAAEYGARLSEWMSTAVADSSSIRAGMTAYATIGHGLCDLNFEGLWFDANSQGFSLTGLSGGPLGCEVSQTQTPCMTKTSLVMSFGAGSPHYKQQVPGKELELNPARIVAYVPNKLLAAMGFTDPATFDAQSFSVSTKDGQTTTPSIERNADGVLVNLGVQHYSQPDPVIKINPRVATPTQPENVARPTLLLNRSKSPTNIATIAKIKIPKGAIARLKVQASTSRNCKIVGTSVKAVAVGACKVALTVKPKKGKPVTKVVTLNVKMR